MTQDETGLEQRLRERFAAIPARLPGEISDSVAAATATRQQSRFNPIIPAVVVAAALGLGAIAVLGGAVRFPLVVPPPPSLASSEAPASSDAPASPFLARGTWRQLALPPISGRSDHRLVWTGSEVLVWGGLAWDGDIRDFPRAPRDGAAYDPEADRWRMILDAPIAGRGSPIVVWSGTEMLVFGGETFDAAGWQPILDGAAYNPATDRWRALPPAPLTGGATVGGWLADRFVVVTNDAAAAYDPGSNSWTELPPAPIRPDGRTAVVAADRLVVIAFGNGASPPVQEATLDPTTWTWESADLRVDPLMAGIDFVSIGDRIVSPSVGMTFDPVTRTWGSVATCDRVRGGVWTGARVIGVQGAWDAATDTCLDVPPSPPREPPFNYTNGREFPVTVWTGEELITWSGGTGVGDMVGGLPKDGAAFRPEP